MVCKSSSNETLLPDPVPDDILQEVPREPGCYILVPFTCYGMHSSLIRTNVWTRDYAAQSTSMQGTRELCERRAVDYNKLCGVNNVRVAFVAAPSFLEHLQAIPWPIYVVLVAAIVAVTLLSWSAFHWDDDLSRKPASAD
eukprot:SRR837773.12227.p1 GENE.SRR837773.12227~~SRR837773.12227.p1  ORF type:complete len:162 (-),score=27.50 SRR837773.12227:67-486(-)